ncbi:MAG: FABP family protein [Acidimicrobiia bacterium]|nr:FABP family protein [Acidimicrobiia bacterium]
MPVPTPAQLGPLAALAGTWEGTKGMDVSFHNEDGVVGDTPYREKVTLSPFGPVDNGSQQLFGLDYRMAAWRGDEEDPFHTEIGYWLWDAARGEIYRCIMVPRAAVVIAGGKVSADSTSFTLTSTLGSTTYGVLENPYLAEKSSTTKFEITIATGADSWSYDETTTVNVERLGGELAHTDRNELHRVSE